MHRKCQISFLERMSSTNQWCVPDEVQDDVLPVDFERSLSGLEVDLCTSSNNMSSVFAVPEMSMRKEELNGNSSGSERCHVECYPLSIAHGKKIRYSQLTDLDCTNSVKRFCFNKEVEHSESFQSGRCRPHSHSTPELRTTSSHFYSPGSVINTFLSQVVQLPVMPISQTIDQGSQGPPPLFYCILLAPTSISTKMNEDTLTYLNQGQAYEIRIKKSSNIPYDKNVLFKSIAHIGFQERRLQYMEKEQIKEWQIQRPGERILEIDLPLSYGIIEAANSSTSINECEFIWDPNHDVGVFLKVNCISTEFTPKKHGGEKGVPFRIMIDTYVNSHPPERLHSASCQVKVFKPKGADRKHKTDREKMYKRLQNDKEKYHPQYDYTILREVPDSWSTSHSNYSTLSTGVSPIPSSPASSAPQSPPFDCLLGSPKRDCFDGPHATSTTENLEISDNDSNAVPLTFDSTSVECVTWLQRNMFGSYLKDFVNFTGADLLNLTRSDLIDICGAANGIRLYNALHGKGCLTTYVRLPTQKAYSAIFLKSTRVMELISKIKSFCGLPADYNCEFYISGPAGTRVIVTDEVVGNMLQDSLFVIECVEGSNDEDCYVFLKQMN